MLALPRPCRRYGRGERPSPLRRDDYCERRPMGVRRYMLGVTTGKQSVRAAVHKRACAAAQGLPQEDGHKDADDVPCSHTKRHAGKDGHAS